MLPHPCRMVPLRLMFHVEHGTQGFNPGNAYLCRLLGPNPVETCGLISGNYYIFQRSTALLVLHQNTSLQSRIGSAYSANISGFSLQLNGTHYRGSQPEGRRWQDY